RVLHDDVLPLLHAALLAVGNGSTNGHGGAHGAVAPNGDGSTHRAGTANGSGSPNGHGRAMTPATPAAASTVQAETAPSTSTSLPAVPTPAMEVVPLLADAHHRVADLLRELPPVPTRATTSDGLVGSLRAAVSELARSFDSTTWHLPNESRPPADGEAPLALSPFATEVVFGAVREAVRNADRHGRGADPSR